jgi:hypothetical protein
MRRSKKPGRVRHAEQQLRDARERLAAALASTITKAEAAALPRSLLGVIEAGVPTLVCDVEKIEAGQPAAVQAALKAAVRAFRVRLADSLQESVRGRVD